MSWSCEAPECEGTGGQASLRLPSASPEEWRTIPGSGGLYSVSNLGRVRSERIAVRRVGRQRGRLLACSCDTKGYPQFQMCLLDGRVIRMKLHRAVALAFLGPRPAGAQINHKSENKLDNSVSNLEYVSCRENIRHGWRVGLYRGDHARGELNCRAKLTEGDVRQIRALKPAMSLGKLARRFGLSTSAISQVVQGKTWRHVA